MSRRKKHAEHANHERWLVSYADFITLLFAFFVVMFASSQADKGKAKQVSESVRQALEEGYAVAKIAAILGGSVDDIGKGNAMMRGPGGTKKGQDKEVGKPVAELDPGVAELVPSLEFLTRELEAEIRAGKLQLSLEPRGLVVSLPQAAFFPTGKDTIDPAMYPSLEKIARVIEKLPNPVRLEGHTDSVPIHNERFASNWELSVARGIAVLKLFTHRFGVPAERLAVAGYADNVPVGSNDHEAGRARNRRVDIVILNRAGLMREPAPARPTGSAKGQKG
ncbi:MAG: flagellar motor protein MotB [Bryobacterales bacterium]|nr:OmpA family protein [Bryobacteraceae bacterium]MDW8354474.1 flagellar motor protein MotB [Bryobacterales bacterium]